MSDLAGFFKNKQKMLLIGAIAVLVVVCVVIFFIREKGTPPSDTDAKKPKEGDVATEKPKPERKVVMSLRIEPTKKTYKLGEPIIVRATLHKNGSAVTMLQMRELVNIHATGTFHPQDGSGMRRLSAPVGAFFIPGGRRPKQRKGPSKEELEQYAKLYPKATDPREMARKPFPQRKDFYELPEGKFALKKEIHLEKLFVLTKPGKITFQLKYDNSVDFYLEGGKRVKIDCWKGSTPSNVVTTIVE